jgi:hypothetical protein
LQIYADAGNADIIYVGYSSSITADSADSTDGFAIPAGGTIFIPVRQTGEIFVISGTASQKIWWMLL